MKDVPATSTPPSPRKRKRERCVGCGGYTDGRHLDRELLQDAVTDDVITQERRGPPSDGCR